MHMYPNGGRASLADAIRAAFGNWRRQHDVQQELLQCGDAEVTRIAKDMQLQAGQLHQMALLPPDSADLVFERMAALGLSPGTIGQRGLGVLRDLERVCSLCTTKKRCRRELAQDPANESWREHCPNASTLAALEEERAVSH